MARTQQSNTTFQDTTVKLDGQDFTNCTFIKSHLVVETGDFLFNSCIVEDCSYEFVGPASAVRDLVLSIAIGAATGVASHKQTLRVGEQTEIKPR